jgi:dolichol kinase
MVKQTLRKMRIVEVSKETDPVLHEAATIDYKFEIIRKLIHLNSLSIPVIYYHIDKQLALIILIPLTFAFLVVDIIRYYNPQIADWFYKLFGFLLRDKEKDEKKKRLNGATNVLLSALFCVILFPKLIFVTAFSILIISDISSALIGRKFGRRKFFAKSLEGATAFFISATIVVFFTPKVEHHFLEYVIGIIAAFFGTLAESMSFEIDDNLSIPITIGTVMWILYTLLLPQINVYYFG